LQPAILVCKNGVAIATQVGRCALVPQHTFFQAGRQRGVGVQLRHSVHQMPAPSKPQPSVTALSRDFARSSFAARPPEAGRSFLPGIALPFTWRPLGKLVDVSSESELLACMRFREPLLSWRKRAVAGLLTFASNDLRGSPSSSRITCAAMFKPNRLHNMQHIHAFWRALRVEDVHASREGGRRRRVTQSSHHTRA